MRPLALISHRFGHMGQHSGYDLLIPPLLKATTVAKRIDLNRQARPAWMNRLLDAGARRVGTSPYYGRHNLAAELRAMAWLPLTGKVLHVLYGEDNLGLLGRLKGHPSSRVVVTLHQPMSWWAERRIDPGRALDGVSAVITLSRSEAAAFGGATRTPVHFVPHGIDVDFFRPAVLEQHAPDAPQQPPRCLFVGNWLRDYATLHAVAARLAHARVPVALDIVTPEQADRSPDDARLLADLVLQPTVKWHRSVGDEQLRTLYQNAALLLLPLRESTANNAILEAMASGLPIVTNETSGIRDYVDDRYAVVTASAHPDEMAAAVTRLLASPSDLAGMSRAARDAAVRTFAWQRVAASVLDVYRSLI